MVLAYTPEKKFVCILRTYLLQTTPEWGFPEEMYHDKEFLEEVEEPFIYYVTGKKKLTQITLVCYNHSRKEEDTMLIGVKYLKKDREMSPREYTYFCGLQDLEIGDLVNAETVLLAVVKTIPPKSYYIGVLAYLS